ncbi:transposase [Flexibacterium corallicola]|uniref:transposase n=1 Tax=Flexibacterium corallicola TaxID=3037259 RepID=UPI00386218E7
MGDLFLLSEASMAPISPCFPRSRGQAKVDDRRVLSGIVFVLKNDLHWRDAPSEYGPIQPFTIVLYARTRWGSMKKTLPNLPQWAVSLEYPS